MLIAAGLLSLLLYEWLSRLIERFSLSEPSFAGQIFPWVAVLTKDDLYGRPLHLTEADELLWRFDATVQFALLLGALAALYCLAIVAAGRVPARTGMRIGLGLGLALLLFQLDSPVMLTSDPFSYAFYGRILGLYHQNPYVQVPAQFPGDPFLELVYWKDVPSFYGPLWTALSAVIGIVAGDHVGLSMLCFRLVAILGALGSGLLIWRIAHAWEPRSANQALVLWLWSPVVILESALSGHNDAVMMVLVLAGVSLVVARHFARGGAAFAAGIAVKLSAALVVPAILLGAWREARQGVGTRVALSVVARFGFGLLIPLSVAVALGGPQSLTVGSLGSGADRYTNSVHEVLLAGARVALGEVVDVATGPLDDPPRTVRVIRNTEIWSAPDGGVILGVVRSNQSAVGINSAQSGWYHVLDPHSQIVGYIVSGDTRPFGRNRDLEADKALRAIQSRLATANTILRGAAWALFIPAALYLLWRARTIREGITSATALTGLFLVLLGAWIWPWYMLWPLALASLQPRTIMTYLIAVLSITPLLLYPAFNFQGTVWSWIFQFRSIYVWVVPAIVYGIVEVWRSRQGGTLVSSAR